jgi:hypothetical protein
MHSYPKYFLPWLWSITGVLFCSGLLLIPGALELRLEWDVPFGLGSARIAVAALHALMAFATLVAIGALIPVHMRLGLRQRRQQFSGLLIVGWFALLALTALGVYYLAHPTFSVIVSVAHIVLGAAMILPLAWHALKGRRLRRQRARLFRIQKAHALTDPFRPVI